MASVFDEKRVHAPAKSYHTPPNSRDGVPDNAADTIADDWQMTLPELVADVPPLEIVRQRLDTYLTDTLAPALDE